MFTTLAIDTGHTVMQSFDAIPSSEHFINVANGEPGLDFASIRINGKEFRSFSLKTGLTLSIDAGPATAEEKNTITLIGRGEVGSFANIVIGNSPSSSLGTLSDPGVRKAEKLGIWGPLVDSVEDNALDEIAIAEKQQILLRLGTPLDLKLARAASHYYVTVNGAPIVALQAGAAPSPGGTAVVLRLPTRSFAAGDAIQINWIALKDFKGQLLSGQLELIAQ